MLLKNGLIWGSDGLFKEADLRTKGKKIQEIAPHLEPLEKETILDVSGCRIYPGMIEAHCHLGLDNSSAGYEGKDFNEMSHPITPQERAIDSINVLDEAVVQARMSGITTVASGPGSANVVGGTFACWKTRGTSIDEMLIDDAIAMKAAFGENPKRIYQGKSIYTRMQIAALLRQLLFSTQDYMEKKEAAQKDISKKPAFDLGLEAMIPVLEKKIPLKCHAHQHNDILTAIRIAREFDLRITLDHCTDGELILDQIKESGFPALIGPSLTHKSKRELAHKSFTTPKAFQEAGILYSITSDSPVVPLEYLPVLAALAMKEGLSEAQAIHAITINPARILGIENRVGSLEPGKDADFILCDASLLDPQNHILGVWIDGLLIPEYQGRFSKDPL